jgi:hypothetical protein
MKMVVAVSVSALKTYGLKAEKLSPITTFLSGISQWKLPET